MSTCEIRRGDGSLPIYRQISDILRQELQDLYKAGDALPSESDLALRFNVNRHTLRRAIDELELEGLVVRRHGKGVFVLKPVIDYQIGPRTRFTETLASQGSKTQSKIIRKQAILAKGGVAARLAVEEGTQVIFLETLRSVNDSPFCVISHFLPLSRFGQVMTDYHGGSLHEFLEERCATLVQRQESLVSAIVPEAADAELLNMPRNLPVLRVKSINVASDSLQPVEYVVTRFRGDATQLSIQP